MARCKHTSGNIQSFTEVCLDCGRNIYETDEEYEASLKREIAQLRGDQKKKRIADLEDLRDALRDSLKDKDSDYGGGEGGW